jgi:PAS domain S-box-containing protein
MITIIPPAHVEVDESRRYVAVDDAACRLLGYSREELLALRIDDVSAPSDAHVSPMFDKYVDDGGMQGIFALRRKNGELILIRFQAHIEDGRQVATWTHYRPLDDPANSQP